MVAQGRGLSGSGSRVLDEFRSGHMFWMPAGSTWLNRDKPRPFALVTPCSVARLGTLVYGSTQQTESRHGGGCVAVEPAPAGLNRNRLSMRTYFYPGTLLPVRYEQLPPHTGFLGHSLHQLRQMLRTALGVGQGSCLAPGAPDGSRRGRIVVLRAQLVRQIRTSLAVVITESGYSAESRYQIILPIYVDTNAPVESHDLLISAREWLAVFPGTVSRVLLPIPATHSVWHAYGISHETEYVLDGDSLAEIDQRLCAYFSLPE